MNTTSKLWLAAAITVMASASHAQIRWLNPTSGLWSTSSNWFNSVAPSSGTGAQDCFIDFTPFTISGGIGSFTTTLTSNVALLSLSSRANLEHTGGTLSLGAGTSLISGAYHNTGANISGGNLTFSGPVTLDTAGDRTMSSGSITFNGSFSMTPMILYGVNGTKNFNGTSTFDDATLRDGIINVGALGIIRKSSGAGSLNLAQSWNGGTREVNNNGLVESLSGTISPQAGGTHTGRFRGVGGTVEFTSNTHTMLTGSKIETGVILNSSTISIPSGNSLEIVGDPVFNGGTIFSTGGNLIGAGTLQISGADKSFGGTLGLLGNINHTGGILYAVNSNVTNNGTYLVVGGRTYRDGIFNNVGTLWKSGAGDALWNTSWSGGARQFNNSGTVLASQGAFQIDASGTHTGSFEGTGTGTVNFIAGTHAFNAGHQLKNGVFFNSGSFQVAGGDIMNCAGTVTMTGGELRRSSGTSPSILGGAGSFNVAGDISVITRWASTSTFNHNLGTIYAVNSTVDNSGTMNLNTPTFWRDGIINNSGTISKSVPGDYTINQSWNGGVRRLDNSGLVSVSDGNLHIGATVTNSGTFTASGAGQITFDSSNSWTLNSGTNLNGNIVATNGEFVIPSGQSAQFNGTTIQNSTLRGAGEVKGSGLLFTGNSNLRETLLLRAPITVTGALFTVNSTLTNDNVLTLNATSGGVNYRDGVLINNGTVQAINGPCTLNQNWNGGARQLQNNGLVKANAGTLNLLANGLHTGQFRTENGGVVNFAEGTHTLLFGTVLATGVVTNTAIVNNAQVFIDGESEFQSGSWSGTGLVRGDTWRWTTTANKGLGGSLHCTADLSHEAGMAYLTNATFYNEGTATIADGSNWRDGILVNSGKFQKLTGAGTSLLSELWSGGARSVTNTGTLHVENGMLQVAAGLTNYAAGTSQMNGGTYSSKAPGNLRLPIGNVVINIGRFILDGPGALVSQSNGTSAITNLADNRGGLELYNGATFTSVGNLLNSGDVIIGAGSQLNPTGTYVQTNGFTKANGVLNKFVTINGGVLGGTGSFLGASVTGAEVAPGDETGTLSSSGNVSMTNSIFNVQVGGTSAGQFDRLAVTGTATISGGTLQADAAPNSTVLPGMTVDVLTATSRTGTFSTLPNPADWSVVYGATFVRLTANRTIQGPVQINGIVDLDGYIASYSTVPLTFEIMNGAAVIQSTVVNPNADGSYKVPTRLRGSYTMRVIGSHWLVKQYSGNITITDSNVNGINFNLTNGDVDQDNEVGPGDFADLVFAFGTAEGDANYNANADLDGDTEVGPGDFGILSANFGQSGD